jgi:hypothetical protein
MRRMDTAIVKNEGREDVDKVSSRKAKQQSAGLEKEAYVRECGEVRLGPFHTSHGSPHLQLKFS